MKRLAVLAAMVVFVAVLPVLPVLPSSPAGAADAEPTGLSPAGGIGVGSSPLFTWTGVPGTTDYRVQVSTDPAYGTTLINQKTVNTAYSPLIELPSGTLYWRVQANDGGGSSAWAAATFNKTLGGPGPTLPADGAILDYPYDPTTFSWGALPAVKSYVLEIDDAVDFIGATKIVTANTSYTLTTTQEIGQPFFWRVKGSSTTGGGGIVTPWSATRTYSVAWPEVPNLQCPLDTTLDAVTDAEFIWDPVAGTDRYELEVSISIDFLQTVIKQTSLRTNRYLPGTQPDNGSYFWRVRAKDRVGHVGNWSEVRSFTRQFGFANNPPCVSAIGSPPPGLAFIPQPIFPLAGEANPDPMRFEWAPAFRAAHYQVQIDNTTSFTSPANCYTIQTKVLPYSGGTGTPGGCGASFWDVPYGQTQYWRVRSVDEPQGDTSLWSSVNAFFRTGDVPAVASPLGSLVDVPLMSWAPVDGAVKYQVVIEDAATQTVRKTANTYASSYTPNTTLTSGTFPCGQANSFRWKVATVDDNGRVGLPSPWDTFGLNCSPATGGSPTPITPTGGPASTDMPSMQWTPVTDATQYDVYVDGVRTEQNVKYPAWTESSGSQWVIPGAHTWYVVAKGIPSLPDVTGPTASFQIDGFGLVYSSHEAVTPDPCLPGQPCTPLQTSPAFSWAQEPFASDFTIWVAFDKFFTNVDRTYTAEWPGFIPREELPDNNVGQAYFWYVQACRPNYCTVNPEGVDVGAPGFQKRSNKVTLDSPADLSTVPDEPLFRWEDYLGANISDPVTPSNLEAKQYKIEVSTVPSFSSTIDKVTTNYTFYTPTNKTYEEGPLYWRVRAVDDSNNNLNWSDARITTKKSPPVVPLTPGDGASSQTVPSFSWVPQVGASRYTIEVYKNADQNFSPGNRVLTATTDNTAYTSKNVLPLGEYAWRIKRLDADGRSGPWNGTGQLFNVVETAVVLTGPADGATFADNNIVFTWFSDLAPATYRFERSSSPAFISIAESKNTVSEAWAPDKKYTNGTWYWRVLARDAAGNVIGTSLTFTIDRITPGVPTAPTAAIGVPANKMVTVSWTAPSSDGGSPITNYTVTASPGGATCPPTASLSCVVSGLTNGTPYTFTVVATNAFGDSPASAASAAVTPSGNPGKPTGVAAIGNNTTATVSWTAPFNGGTPITGYTVTATPGGAVCATGGTTSCVVPGLTNYLPYTFQVQATNANGNGFASTPSPAVMPSATCGPAKPGPFPDVTGTHTFCVHIEWLETTGITGGFADGTYKPGRAITRMAMAAFLYRYSGSPAYTPPATPTFPDVPTTDVFYKEIEWLASTGVTGGFPDGTFRPTGQITRMAMAAFLYRSAGSPAYVPPGAATFPDVPTTHVFYKEIEWLASTGITGGFSDGTYRPNSAVTRQAMAAFLLRYFNLGF